LHGFGIFARVFTLHGFFNIISNVNGQKKWAMYDFSINIGGFDFNLDIVVANIREKTNFPMILGRSFFTTANLILDGEHG
jgi:hypothetical protein